jgi:diguanylate cyclase (GGDEF)-like protein
MPCAIAAAFRTSGTGAQARCSFCATLEDEGGSVRGLDRERVTFAAASMRFVLGAVALFGLPLLLRSMAQYVWVLGLYLALAGLFQWLLWKDIGGEIRKLGSGVIDLLIITFIVHHVGSAATMLVSLYILGVVLNTLVVGRREGLILGVLAAVFYAALLFSEVAGVLPYAPDAPSWISGPPSWSEAIFFAGIMGVMTVAASALVGALVHQSSSRQAELERANQKLQELSLRDPLTQLYNRRYLMERLESELARVRRGRMLAVVMVDLDRFKRVNDDTGHARGDALLQELAQALARSVRETDVAGRYGGDEFVVILPDTDEAQAAKAAARLVEGIRAVGTRFDPERPVTASVGLAVARADDDARGLLQRADRASYSAKSDGGDRVARESMIPPSGRKPVEQHAQ